MHVKVAIGDSEPAGEPGLTPDGSPDIPEPGHSTATGTIEKRIALAAALKAGFFGVLLGMVPLVGNILTGSIAVLFYRRAGGASLASGPGSRLGGAAGAVAFAISAAFTVIQVFVFHAGKESEEAMLRLMKAIGVDPANPEILDSIHRLFTPSGMAIAIVFGMIIAVALAAIGGALASAVGRPRSRA